MKRILLTLCLCCGYLMLSAQSRISYSNTHLLCVQGDYTNVVDLQLEWPEWVDGHDVTPLQQFIAKHLFGVEATTKQSAMQLFVSRYGVPMEGKFKTIPDDNKFCYVTCKLLETGYQQGRFISYRLSRTVEPGKDSQFKSDTLNLLITYDLLKAEIKEMKQIIKVGKLSGAGYSKPEAVQQLLANASIDLPQQCGIELLNACLIDVNRILVDGNCVETYDDYDAGNVTVNITPFSSMFTGEVAQWLFNNDTKKMLKQLVPTNVEPMPQSVDSINNEPVYRSCDNGPVFPGGTAAMRNFLAKNIVYPKLEGENGVSGKVIVSFVVTKTGQIVQPCVVQQVSPLIDGEAVRVVGLMPKWTPGVIGGKPVNVLVSLPISFHL